MTFTVPELTATECQQLADVMASMSAEDRGFVEGLPKVWEGWEDYAPVPLPYRAAVGFVWPMGMSDGLMFNVHLLLPEGVVDSFHSHEYDNKSVILSGGYREVWRPRAWDAAGQTTREFRTGDTIFRKADEGHFLTLLPGLNYAITAFGRGPHVNQHYYEAPYADGVIGPVRKIALATAWRRKIALATARGRKISLAGEDAPAASA